MRNYLSIIIKIRKEIIFFQMVFYVYFPILVNGDKNRINEAGKSYANISIKYAI